MSVKEILEEYTCELEGDHYSPEEVDKVVKAIQSLLNEQLDEAYEKVDKYLLELSKELPNIKGTEDIAELPKEELLDRLMEIFGALEMDLCLSPFRVKEDK